ncbi:hypothetical protein H8K38_11475 [Undibacterium sp. FT79W]|uniref:hypothetical protein n=1 Tax=Undibacterium sp. FT79W TaxID=2762296 RepID=UPI00164A9239|nr:hypothetical protein [Undibacterium sp. FT79W]MBC3878433.1 hypothetical protein [Undibacterium sp. FT79W]
MEFSLGIQINGTNVTLQPGERIAVKERDEVQFFVNIPPGFDVPVLYVEDHEVNFESQTSITGFTHSTKRGIFFREVMGLSMVRCEFNRTVKFVTFDVLINKLDSHQIEGMIRYLYSHSDSLIRVCLARSTMPAGSQGIGNSDPEAILTTAERFVTTLLNGRLELQSQLRKRLVPQKKPVWDARAQNTYIDPQDVLSNLDGLLPVTDEGDLFIQGKHFSLSGVDVTAMINSTNVYENAVIIGGIYSVRRGIEELYNQIQVGKGVRGVSSHDKEHESLTDVLARVTVGNIRLRCSVLIEQLNDLLRYFRNDLNIAYKGEIQPVITPYVRSSRIYHSLFSQIHEWYSLGAPSLSGLHLLLKLRTVSKIYEYFCLFKLLEYFLKSEWTLRHAIHMTGEDSLIPGQVDFTSGDYLISLFYDKPIAPMSGDTVHNDLVDLRHLYSNHDYWWRPDFVIRFERSDNVRYFILDAKYSKQSIVEGQSLPDLINKYFLDTGVFDANRSTITSNNILAIIALYPGAQFTKNISSHWKTKFFSKIPRLPLAAGATLSTYDDTIMSEVMDKLLEVGISHTNEFHL